MAHDDMRLLIDDPTVRAVEIKLTVRGDQEHLVRSALERTSIPPLHRRVYFMDRQDLSWFDSGLVIRVRRTEGAPDDLTVKLRPVVPAEIGDDWKERDDFSIEVDVVGTTRVCSAKLAVEPNPQTMDGVLAGEREPEALLSEDQARLIAEHAPVDANWTDWIGIQPLGPIEVDIWDVHPAGFDHPITVEEWVLPDGTDLIELSSGVAPEDAARADEELRAYLRGLGLDVDGDQQTKARTALYSLTGRRR